MTQTTLKVVINDVEFTEIPNRLFVIHGEEDKFPFLESIYKDERFFPNIHRNPHRYYKSIVINGKYYAPIIK